MMCKKIKWHSRAEECKNMYSKNEKEMSRRVVEEEY